MNKEEQQKDISQVGRKESHTSQHERMMFEEKRISDVSKLSYRTIDYTAQLVKEAWVDPPLPDFSHLLEEEKIKVRRHYNNIILQRAFVMIAGLCLTPLIPSAYTLLLAIMFGLLMSFFIFSTVALRQRVLFRVEKKIRQEIKHKIDHLREVWHKQKEEHDEREEARVTFVKEILDGNLFAWIRSVNMMLLDLHMPFEIIADVKTYEGTMQIIVELPSRAFIPMQKVIISPEGKISVEAKDREEINRQHIELCSAMIVRITALLVGASIGFENFYVNGVFDVHCYISLKTDKETMEKACNEPSGLAAISLLEGRINFVEDGDVQEVEPILVEEWDGVDEELIKTLQLKCSVFESRRPASGN